MTEAIHTTSKYIKEKETTKAQHSYEAFRSMKILKANKVPQEASLLIKHLSFIPVLHQNILSLIPQP